MSDTQFPFKVIHKTHDNGKGLGEIKFNGFATTSDASGDIVYAHALAEGRALKIHVSAVSIEDDASEAGRYDYTHCFRRAAAGNVTAVGSATSVAADDSSGTPTVTVAANTSDQTCDVTLTGEAEKDLNWQYVITLEEIKI